MLLLPPFTFRRPGGRCVDAAGASVILFDTNIKLTSVRPTTNFELSGWLLMTKPRPPRKLIGQILARVGCPVRTTISLMLAYNYNYEMDNDDL